VNIRNKAVAAAAAMCVCALAVAGAQAAQADQSEPCQTMSTPCMIQVGLTYIDSLTDPALAPAIRLAPTAQRWENGILYGASGDEIRQISAAGDTPPGSTSRDIRAWTSGNQVFFFWLLDVPVGTGLTVHIAERIGLGQGDVCGDSVSPCITQIEVMDCIAQVPNEPAMPPGPELPGAANLVTCLRSG
jgi:hypothetical protein